ncbi:YaaL family protein [Bacillus sp. FJAT-50079]|uniref:YaaL family protein n=1 Tax=Bacillus sp. FJAT-50079 TaxID=2833577 RepID=UPI001BC90892|nr:YaaL family protein [Bacillus sp. FJAT-50079]MBS4210772.1 YaaL family protein [Bacillus sp. FJAT-50079]
MFRRKRLRKEYDQRLLDLMESTKEDWMKQKQIEKLSYEHTDQLRYETKLAKAKYFFLFREAKLRPVSLKTRIER